jgi:flagellar biosynthesis/type III secretory pathway protein FliH
VTAVPITRYLVQFDRHERVDLPEQRPGYPVPPPDPALAAQAFAEQIAEAHRRGAEEGRTAAATACDLRIEQERAGLEARLVAERAKWVSEEARQLTARIDAAFGRLQDTLAASIERILRPVLTKALRERTLGLLREALSVLLSADEPAVLRISGPHDLLSALGADLASAHRPIECVPDDRLDVRMIAERTLVESQLEAWIAKLHEVPGAE